LSMKDRNTTERTNFEHQQDKWDHRREQAEDQARAEFRIGELDELIDEQIADQAMDARNIALHAMFPDEIVEFKPSRDDFINMVEHIIDTRVDEILEEWK
jgi:hypothetical protein